MREGTVLTVTFELAGTEFMALNGGSQFRLRHMIQDPDSAKRDRVLGAMMTMVKLDIGKLEAAYKGA